MVQVVNSENMPEFG